jgi:uncharacterized protein YneF (UPF0154 family)
MNDFIALIFGILLGQLISRKIIIPYLKWRRKNESNS